MRQLLYNALVAIRAVPPPPRPLTWESFFGESSTLLSGVAIDESNALNYSPIWCGVTTLSRDIAKLPLVLYKNDLATGGKTPFKTHGLYRLLHDEPNPEMSSFKFRETMQALCLLYGNAYAEIVRDTLKRVVGLYPIIPTRVDPMRSDRGLLFYRVKNYNGSTKDVAAANMLHISSLSTDGILGHGIVMHARESIGLGVATEKFGASFFGNGSTFGGVVEVPGSLKGPDGELVKDNVRKAIEAVHAGVERAHKILVLGAGSKFTERGTKPNEAQFIETRKFQINETARWLAMPPHKLGDLENAHFTNIEEQELQYYVGTVSGWLEMWEQELTRKLVSPLEYSQQTIEHNLDGVLRGDSAKRAEFYSKMHGIGAFSINDILRKENMNPIGPEGDAHLVPLNMIPAERYTEYIDVTIQKMKAPPAQKALPASEPAADDARMQALVDEIRAASARAEEHVARAVAAEAKGAQDTEQAASFQVMAEQERAAAMAAAEDLQTARTALAEMATERDQAVQAHGDLATARQAAEQRAMDAEMARAEAATLADEQAALVVESERKLAAAVLEARASADKLPALEAAVTEAQEARRELSEREVALETAQLAQVEAERLAGEARAQAETLTASLAVRKADELDRLTRVVAAHRALIVDVVGRVLRPEVDRARRRQVTPESLRKWAEAFYQTHRDVCADALYPAVLTHLAWKRSEEDPRTVARALAEAHCAQSEGQLAALVTRAEPDEFHGELEQLLLRWEQERPSAVADTILADEIRYIGSLS